MNFSPYDPTHTKLPEALLAKAKLGLSEYIAWKEHLKEHGTMPESKFEPPFISVERGIYYDMMLVAVHDQYDCREAFLKLAVDNKGNILARYWMLKDKLHREHLPARIEYDEEGKITRISFRRISFLNDVLVSNEEMSKLKASNLTYMKDLTFWETYELAPDHLKDVLLREWLPFAERC